MFISETEVTERLESSENIINKRSQLSYRERKLARVRLPEAAEDTCAIAPLHNGGRRPGDTNLSAEQRASIGAQASIETLAEVADSNGVSLHHVHELSHGKHSNAQGENPALVDAINEKLEGPHDIALKKLTSTLLAIDETKLKSMKPKDLAAMASSLSRVSDSTAPLKREDPLKDCRLVVYAPTVKQENYYESVAAPSPAPSQGD